MKKYRIVYWCCSYTTESFVKAANKTEAEKKFRERCERDVYIFGIEECYSQR